MTQARAVETEAKGCRSLAMARSGSVIAQTGLSSGWTAVVGQGSAMAHAGGGGAVNGQLEQRRQWLRTAARQVQ